MEGKRVYNKYNVTHSDGTPCDPDSRYFVLKLNSKDPKERHRVRAAVFAYCMECDDEDYVLNIIKYMNEKD